MHKIFYEPKTLAIKGFSDGELSMTLPFVESDLVPLPVSNYKIEMRENVPTLIVLKESFTDEEWNAEIKK